MSEFTFRKAIEKDIPVLLGIYENAKKFMHNSGNLTQWVNGYPGEKEIRNDIKSSILYVGLDTYGDIALVFVFIIGEEPTYNKIDGEWINNKPYGTIHRIASSGKYSRTLDKCLDFCYEQIDNIRIDTHRDNSPMINALKRNGFKRCGVIICANGTEREAFQCLRV